MLVRILKHRGCKQRGFLTIPWVNHNSKMTNGALIQFMNYAVVMATFIKMHQSMEHFVYEIMIYHVWLFSDNQPVLWLLAAVHTASKRFCIKVFTAWFVGVCITKVLGKGTGAYWKETALTFRLLCQKVLIKYQQSTNNRATFGHTTSQTVCVVLDFAEMRERERETRSLYGSRAEPEWTATWQLTVCDTSWPLDLAHIHYNSVWSLGLCSST